MSIVKTFIDAVAGDTAKYHIGKKIGKGILEKEDVKYINKDYIKKAQHFYKNTVQ